MNFIKVFVISMLFCYSSDVLANDNESQANISCKSNPMVIGQYCSSEAIDSDTTSKKLVDVSYYSFATNDSGTVGYITFSWPFQLQSLHPNQIIIKLDDSNPITITDNISSYPSRVNCRSICTWSVGVYVKFDEQTLEKMRASKTMLVSYKTGDYVSMPMTVNPQLINKWIINWEQIKK